MVDSNKGGPNWSRAWGIGFEYAAVVGGFTFVGYWIDRYYDTSPGGILIGAGFGLVGGTYNLIREGMAASREAQCQAKKKESGDE